MNKQQQPAMGVPMGEPAVGEFSSGLCDCFSDVSLCKSFF